jgi:hypothetical protein
MKRLYQKIIVLKFIAENPGDDERFTILLFPDSKKYAARKHLPLG